MFFKIGGELKIKIPKKLINDTVIDVIYGFLYRSVKVELIPHDKLEIIMGELAPIDCVGECAYNVTEKGVYISAKNERELLTALFMVLQDAEPTCLEMGKEEIRLSVNKRQIDTGISRRMIHFCLFPKIPLSSYYKLVRLAGVLGFTHVILEFWGTLKYDFMNELSWKNESFEKQEILGLINEIRCLGMQPVPMFNHFGHASQSRLNSGKHVTLNQNPRLAPLFSFDGWWWNFSKDEVRSILKNIRKELMELFGYGEFFHIGFDESFSYPTDEKSTEKLCAYIKDLLEEVVSEGRIPLLWGDLFLHERTLGIGKDTGYEGNCPSKEMADKMIECINEKAVVCDWQYFVKQAPWISAKYFKDKNVKMMICPWTDISGMKSGVQTAKEYNAFGFMLTTWHHPFVYGNISGIMETYYHLYGIDKSVVKIGNALANATLLRKLYFPDGDYEKSGFNVEEVENVFSK